MPCPRRRPVTVSGLAIAAVLVTGACAGDDEPDAAPSPTISRSASVTPSASPSVTASAPASPSEQASGSPLAVPPGARPGQPTVLATDLAVPWGLAFLPDGSALVSERDAAVIRRVGADGSVTEVGEVAGVVPGGEGGLLGLALSPRFASDRLLYAYHTAAEDNRVVRMQVQGELAGPLRLSDPQPVLTGIPKSGVHNGGRIAFGPDGLLYVGTGDAGDADQAQDPMALGGKILRVTPDGQPAPGNPFPGSPTFSYGHRNVQGLAFAADGRLYATEFGQNTFDEVNLIAPGGNYGWPLVEGPGDGADFVQPLVVWDTSEASPSGAAIAGDALYAAALRGRRLWVVPFTRPAAFGEPQPLLTGEFGRLRHVALAPDRSLWVLTSNRDGRGSPQPADDRVLRLPLS